MNWVRIGSGSGFSPDLRQTIASSVVPWVTNINEISIDNDNENDSQSSW